MSPGRNNPSIADGDALLAERVFDGHTWHIRTAVLVRGGRIVGLGPWGDVPPDWPQTRLPAGAFLAPGFIDLQVNGGNGVFLNDQPTADGMRAIARAHRRYGTTACLPTLISDTPEQNSHCRRGGAFNQRAGRGPRTAPGRPLHQSAAARRPPARSDCETGRGRPRTIMRTRQCRPVVGHAGA